MTMTALDAALDPLRRKAQPGGPVTPPVTDLCPGVWLNGDPEAGHTGQWTSPSGRLCELVITPEAPGHWLGLHIALPPLETDGLTWLSLTLRGHAARPIALKPCLRSGVGEGFSDSFFDRHILLRPAESDHALLMAPAQYPDLPDTAPWRELILFLPPGEALSLALHDVRLIAL